MILISKTFKSNEDKKSEDIKRQILFSGERFALEYFINAFTKKGYVVKRKRKFIGINSVALFCRINFDPLTASELSLIHIHTKKQGYKKLLILCNEISPAAAKIANQLPDIKTDIYDFSKTLKLIDWLNLPMKITVDNKEKKNSVRTFLSAAFNVKRANAYFFGGIMMLIFSQAFGMTIYYLVFGCVLITLSLGIRIFSLYKKHQSAKIK